MNRAHDHWSAYFRPGRPVWRQAGLSLVELMVAMTISLVILAALVALFTNTSRSNREFARANSMIESGRLAVQVLEADLQHAGYWGTYVASFDDQTSGGTPDDAPSLVPDPCLDYSTPWTVEYVESLIGIPLQAYDDATVCAGIIANRLADTDVLVVRHAENCVPGESPNCDLVVPGRLYFQASRCTTDLDPFVLDTAGFNLLRRECDPLAPAEIRRFMSTLYYVRDYALTLGDGIPTLMRSQFDLSGGVLQHEAAVPLIEGVAGFRVELGVDDLSETGDPVDYTAAIDWVDPEARTSSTNRGDGVPDDTFIHCTTAAPCTVGELTNVTAVRLHILARSREPSQGLTDTKTYTLGDLVVGPFNDSFQRHAFTTTVRLPNISGRRITP